jgi:hypothetical protein
LGARSREQKPTQGISSLRDDSSFSSQASHDKSIQGIGQGGMSLDSRFNAIYAKARAINTVRDVNHSEARAKARIDYNEQLSNRIRRPTEDDGKTGVSYYPTQSLQSSAQNNLPRVSSKEHLRAFEAKIAKTNERDGNSYSEPSQNSSQKSLSSYESKLQRKQEGSVAPKTSQVNLDDFEAKIARKAKEDGASRSESHKMLSSQQSKLQKKLEARLAEKNAQRESKGTLDDYEARIMRKAKANDTSNHKSHPPPSRGSAQTRELNNDIPKNSLLSSLSSYEAKLEQKLAKEDKNKRANTETSQSSYELKLQKKLAKKNHDK